jgi:hypothetical protein
MDATLRQIEGRMLAVMPVESTIDRVHHAHAVASVVIEARRQAARRMQEAVETTRARLELTNELIQNLKDRISAHEARP